MTLIKIQTTIGTAPATQKDIIKQFNSLFEQASKNAAKEPTEKRHPTSKHRYCSGI